MRSARKVLAFIRAGSFRCDEGRGFRGSARRCVRRKARRWLQEPDWLLPERAIRLDRRKDRLRCRRSPAPLARRGGPGDAQGARMNGYQTGAAKENLPVLTILV